eukprot:12937635-Prorocentrum_lima.AAC.1
MKRKARRAVSRWPFGFLHGSTSLGQVVVEEPHPHLLTQQVLLQDVPPQLGQPKVRAQIGARAGLDVSAEACTG